MTYTQMIEKLMTMPSRFSGYREAMMGIVELTCDLKPAFYDPEYIAHPIDTLSSQDFEANDWQIAVKVS